MPDLRSLTTPRAVRLLMPLIHTLASGLAQLTLRHVRAERRLRDLEQRLARLENERTPDHA